MLLLKGQAWYVKSRILAVLKVHFFSVPPMPDYFPASFILKPCKDN